MGNTPSSLAPEQNQCVPGFRLGSDFCWLPRGFAGAGHCLCLQCLLKEEGQQEGRGPPRTPTYPCCLCQVSVNPAYQAPELEYVLKKVRPIPGGSD